MRRIFSVVATDPVKSNVPGMVKGLLFVMLSFLPAVFPAAGHAQAFRYRRFKVTPTITWAAPSPINSGTPLNATQLDATANVPGSFVYTPGFGAVLSVGTYTL